MRIEQRLWSENSGWVPAFAGSGDHSWHLVLIFGMPAIIKRLSLFNEIRSNYPKAIIFGCSSGGEICGARVHDNSIVLTAIHFERTRCFGAQISIGHIKESFQAGQTLVKSLPGEDLQHLLVFCDGLNVNGSELVKGLSSSLPENVSVTGGLAADSEHFKETLVCFNAPAQSNIIAAVGLYGGDLKIGFGSRGGWDPFGPERRVTRSIGNILYEMDHRSALDLYKLYLGSYAQGLPLTGMHFPLSLRSKENGIQVFRGALNVNDSDGSLYFGGDIPEGSYARLMKGNIDRLIDGASTAAELSKKNGDEPELALLISCFGRKQVLRQRSEEEVEGIQDVLGDVAITGFYSFGEICPNSYGEKAAFQNLSMTITTIKE